MEQSTTSTTILLFLTAIHLLVTGINCADECGKDIEDVLAECTKKHLEDSFSVPKSVRDLNSKCLSFKEAGLCLKNFAFRCMDDESRIKTGLILSGISLVGSSFCASQKEKEDFIAHSNCLNSSTTITREIYCRKSFMQALRVAKFARTEMKVGVSCCYYNEFSKCLDSLFLEAGDRCSVSTYDYFKDMASKFRANTIDMLCGYKYNRFSEKCDLIVGNPISGRDILVKYLVGVFASKPDDKRLL